MSNVSNFKALCYNCLYKLAESDTNKNVCPRCNMKVDNKGFPIKGSSNYSWKKSDSDNKSIDETINKNLAVDQGFHYGTVSRLRYGITEGNDEKFIINPDKSFMYNFNSNKLMIHRYKLTRHPTDISRTSSLNLMRNSIKEMITNSKQTPSILYIQLKETKPNLPKHIILLEDKFLKARYGSVTGLNMLLNIIHTNNFFPVTSSLHRQTAIYKVENNYEKTISESFLMPSSGLSVLERIPHNHLSLHDDEDKLKKEIENSLKFINIKEFHQYIPTTAKKSNMVFDEGVTGDTKSSGNIEETMDDNLSQLSEISVTSEGEVTSKSTKSKKVSLGHLGIKVPNEDDYESIVEVSEEIDSMRTEEDTSSIRSKKAVLSHLGVQKKSSDKSQTEDDDESGTGSNIGVDFLNDPEEQSIDDRKSSDRRSEEATEDDESGTGSHVGVDFLNESDERSSDDRKSSDQRSKQQDRDDESGTGSHVGVDFLNESEQESTDDKKSGERHSQQQDEDDESGTGSHVGVDFLNEYDEQSLDDTKSRDKKSVDRKTQDKLSREDIDIEQDSMDLGFLSDLENVESEGIEEIDDENVSNDDSVSSGATPKNVFKDDLEDIDDYPTAMHSFWGEFKKSRSKKTDNTTITSWDGDENDTEDELDIPTQSDRGSENKVTKKKKPKIKTTPPKKKVTLKKKLKKTSDSESDESPKKTTNKKRLKKTSKGKKRRDSKGRFISSGKKTVTKNKSKRTSGKRKSPRKKTSRKNDTKSRDSKGRFKTSKKKKIKLSKNDKRSRDSKGRFRKSP